MTSALAELLEYLEPEERRELDAHLIALTTGVAHTQYQSDPIGWAVEKLGIPEHTIRWSLNPNYQNHEWDGTVDPLAVAFEAIRDWKDVAIESGTGTGKSFGVAILILWFLACFEDAEVYTFALNEEQLKLYIWKNITELWPKFSAHFPSAELTSLTIRMKGGIDETWSAHGRAIQIKAGENVATRAAGMHAEHMLLVYEEMAAMDKSVPAAGKNTCTAPHNLRIGIGNPNHQLDTLHLMTQEHGVVAIRMSALDHPNVVTANPNVVPGAVSQKSIDNRLADYGETSPVYQSRVRGVSPEQASDALIRLEWLKAAAKRYEARRLLGSLPALVTGKGVDAANSEHGDRAAISDWCDNVALPVRSFACPDSNLLGSQVVTESRRHGLPAERVGVDAIGVGAGTVNEARRLNFFVMALYAGANPMVMAEKKEDGTTVEWTQDVNRFKTLRSQMYWQAREDLRKGVIDVAEDLELWQELTAPTFDDQSKVVVVQPKDEIKLLIGRSPDKADAFVMGNWVRKRTVEAIEREVPQGVTLGYDFTNRKPRERETAEQEIAKMLQRAQPNLIGSRYSIPNRRGR